MVGESESSCSGGGDKLPDRCEPTEACVRKSFASWFSSENEWEERAEGGKSSNEVRNEDRDVILLMLYRLGRLRNREGPGSLSTVANDIEDMRLML